MGYKTKQKNMSSINLLPENFINKRKETMAEGQSGLSMLVSFLMISIVIFVAVFLYISNKDKADKIAIISARTEKVNQELGAVVKENDFMDLESKAKDASVILSEQSYFSQVFDYFEKVLSNGVYLKSLSMKISNGGVVLGLSLNAKDYLSISEQLHIFKGSDQVSHVKLNGLEPLEDGTINFGLEIEAKGDLVRFK